VFLSAKGVSNMLIYLVEFSSDLFIFFRVFFYFPKTKNYLFEVLKTFLEALIMFFEFIGCQNMSRNFPGIFEPLEHFFSDIKYRFRIF
jgi:hypothetical protein